MKKILVVDDESVVLNMEARFFELFNFSVVRAATAQEGLDYIIGLPVSEHPNAVLTDVNTGGAIDGLQLAMMVYEVNPSICMYVTSGCMEPEQQQRLAELTETGAVKGFYPKPNDNLIAMVKEIQADLLQPVLPLSPQSHQQSYDVK